MRSGMNDPYRLRRIAELRQNEAMARRCKVWYLTAMANVIRWWRRVILLDDYEVRV